MPALEVHAPRRVRLQTKQIPEHVARGGVVSSEVEGRCVGVAPCREALTEARFQCRTLRAHGLGQIAEATGVMQVQARRSVISEYPRKNRVLSKIVVRTSYGAKVQHQRRGRELQR